MKLKDLYIIKEFQNSQDEQWTLCRRDTHTSNGLVVIQDGFHSFDEANEWFYENIGWRLQRNPRDSNNPFKGFFIVRAYPKLDHLMEPVVPNLDEEAKIIPFPSDQVKSTEKQFDQDAQVISIREKKRNLVASLTQYSGGSTVAEYFKLAAIVKPFSWRDVRRPFSTSLKARNPSYKLNVGQHVLALMQGSRGGFVSEWTDVWDGKNLETVPTDVVKFLE